MIFFVYKDKPYLVPMSIITNQNFDLWLISNGKFSVTKYDFSEFNYFNYGSITICSNNNAYM